MKERQESPSPKPSKKKKQQPTIVLWFGLFWLLSRSDFHLHRQGDDLLRME